VKNQRAVFLDRAVVVRRGEYGPHAEWRPPEIVSVAPNFPAESQARFTDKSSA